MLEDMATFRRARERELGLAHTHIHLSKACGCYSVHHIPIFDWCVVRRGLKTNIIWTRVEKRLDHIFTLYHYSTLNSDYIALGGVVC